MIKEIGGAHVAVIGQAFPYVPVAHPRRFTPDWTFGIREQELQALIDGLRSNEKADAVLLLSHNGMDVDLKLASRVRDVRYRLLPVFSELLKPDAEMVALIDKIREPKVAGWSGKIAMSDRLLYRRDNFTGSVDQLICTALRREFDTEIALSPGFRWGATFLANQPLTMEDVMAETAITYPETYVSRLTGAEIKNTLEDVCDNLFNPDPYLQQGGDMVRIGGLTYSCTPSETIGRRISDLKLDNGRTIEPHKHYRAAGWAAVNAQQGIPVWDVLAKQLGSGKPLVAATDNVALRGVTGNPGIAEQ
jgi:sulfur-oxidizing protein SoxB